ncbi:UVR8 [Symbiodinium sp. CCMP2592]|nr:UVR8 [Symbiodinium sp. CCMP2592]
MAMAVAFFEYLPERGISLRAAELRHLCWILADVRKRSATFHALFYVFRETVPSFLAVPLQKVTLAAGAAHTCAVKASGELVCFGHSGYGQCDVPASLGPVVTVAAGASHTCAVKASGELVCFGDNRYGQCDVPANLGPVVAVAAGSYHNCAVKASGELVCFGSKYEGWYDVPAKLGPVVAVAAGGGHTCAVKASGELVCFGANAEYQCDVPANLGPVVAVAAGGCHTCPVKASGELVCFGASAEYQCDVPTNLGPVVAVAAGEEHACALKASGELVCFGGNDYGQCDVPANLGPVVAVAAGGCHTCAVKACGELVCFGLNHCGQCDVPATLGLLSSRIVPTSLCSGERADRGTVTQVVHHTEAAAQIHPDEAAAIVAEQEASLIQHNIDSTLWTAHEEDAESDSDRRFRRLILLEFTRCPAELTEVLEQSEALRPTREALTREGFHWLQPTGAKVIVEPELMRLLRSQRSVELRAHHVLVTEDLEDFVMDAVHSLPSRRKVRLRSATPMALTDGDELVLVRRTFLHLPPTQLHHAASVAQSTTEARVNHGTNPRRVFAHTD